MDELITVQDGAALTDTAAERGPPHTAAVAVEQLRNLHEGEAAISGVVAWGEFAVPSLEALLCSPSQAVPHSRCWAADALAGIGSRWAILALIRALRDSSTRVLSPVLQESEAVVLGRIAEHLSVISDAHISDELLEVLRQHPASPSCVRAVGRRRDPRALALLGRCLFEDASRAAAAEALRLFGERAVPQLLGAVEALPGNAASEAPTHIEGRRVAATLLNDWLGSGEGAADAGASARAVLVRRLRDSQPSVRLAAAIALSGADAADAECIAQILVSALGEIDWSQLGDVTHALERLGPIALNALDPVIGNPRGAALQRIRAVQLAGRMKTTPLAPLLSTLSEASDAGLRWEAIRALGRMPSLEESLLVPFLTDPSSRIRRTAFTVLRRRRALGARLLLALLADPDARIQLTARRLLRKRPRQTLPLVTQALRSAGAPSHGIAARWRLCRQAATLWVQIRCSRGRDARDGSG